MGAGAGAVAHKQKGSWSQSPPRVRHTLALRPSLCPSQIHTTRRLAGSQGFSAQALGEQEGEPRATARSRADQLTLLCCHGRRADSLFARLLSYRASASNPPGPSPFPRRLVGHARAAYPNFRPSTSSTHSALHALPCPALHCA